MEDLRITSVDGNIPVNCITGQEFEEAIENLDILRRTVAAESVWIKVTSEGKITVKLNGMDQIDMEAEELWRIRMDLRRRWQISSLHLLRMCDGRNRGRQGAGDRAEPLAAAQAY